MRVDLSVAALQALEKPVVGQGGFQSLLRQLQAQISDGALILTPALITKIVRYVKKYMGRVDFRGAWTRCSRNWHPWLVLYNLLLRPNEIGLTAF